MTHQVSHPVCVGIDRLLHPAGQPLRKRLAGRRIGLFTHLAAVDAALVPTLDRVAMHDDLHVQVVYTPEHGLYGVQQAGERVDDAVHPRYGLPIRSLYGGPQQTAAERATDLLAADLDLLLVDIQDIGVRFYTYLAALQDLLAAAAEVNMPVMILDRPNPLTGVRVEGIRVQEGCFSYVSRLPIPLRHGLTVGEAARWMQHHFGWSFPLDVIEVEGWQRDRWGDQLGRPWVPPSPNMPTLDTAIVYPGLALLEGTNVSEGRGTTRPFELFGAPWVQAHAMLDAFDAVQLPGVRLRATHFVPMFSKYQGQLCHGLQVHVTDREAFAPLRMGVELIRLLAALHPSDFAWLPPSDPLNGRPFIDLLAGTTELRQSLHVAYKKWEADAEAFRHASADHFLYL